MLNILYPKGVEESLKLANNYDKRFESKVFKDDMGDIMMNK